MTRPSVTYCLPFSSFSGGVKVVAHHCSGLARRGWDCRVLSMQPKPDWFADGEALDWHDLPRPGELGAALKERRGVKVATWPTTASWVAASLNDGDRGFYLVQDEDFVTYAGREDWQRDSFRHGLHCITESQWVEERLRDHYGVESTNVSIGISELFHRPLPMVRGPLRVLTPARTTSAGRADLKGWPVARETLRIASTLVPGLGVVTFGQERIPSLGFMPHVHVHAPNDRKLRELYCSAAVYLSCSRHEGFGLPIAEALASGCAVVCTDAHGNRETCIDGVTALYGDSPDALARAIQTLTDRPAYARRLAEAGQALARKFWWPAVVDRLEGLFGGGSN